MEAAEFSQENLREKHPIDTVDRKAILAPQMNRIRTAWIFLLVALAMGARLSLAAVEEPRRVRGADELFWVPTLEQALEMARATGRPLFLMGYSLVDNGTTYTK